MIYFNILCIGVIMVFITDISGVTNHIENTISKILGFKTQVHIKLIECSLCQCWWLSLLYIALTGNLNIPMIAYCGMIAMLTPVIGDLLNLIRDIIGWVINGIDKKLL